VHLLLLGAALGEIFLRQRRANDERLLGVVPRGSGGVNV
jgi:hypothetical protein